MSLPWKLFPNSASLKICILYPEAEATVSKICVALVRSGTHALGALLGTQ